VQPNRIAGVSIGALNTAIVAGNAPENGVEALRGFWNSICHPTLIAEVL
jgi:NTE family protein